MSNLDEKQTFLKAYSNVPINLRNDIIVVIEGKPMTWNVAFIEVSNNSELGNRILSVLVEIGILKG